MNAHGTSTKKNDHFETVAFKSVFGSHASKLRISSIKVNHPSREGVGQFHAWQTISTVLPSTCYYMLKHALFERTIYCVILYRTVCKSCPCRLLVLSTAALGMYGALLRCSRWIRGDCVCESYRDRGHPPDDQLRDTGPGV